MVSRRKYRRSRAVWAFLAVLVLAIMTVGVAQAADEYWVVGGTGQNIYFVPVAGAKFPNDHRADLTVVDMSQVEYDPQADAPILLDPTWGIEVGNRLPAAGSSIAVTPTSDKDNAGEAKIMLTFERDQDDPNGNDPAQFITVDKWVVAREWKAWPGGNADTALNPTETINSTDLGFTGNVSWTTTGGTIISHTPTEGNEWSQVVVRYDTESTNSTLPNAARVKAYTTAANGQIIARTIFEAN